MRPIVFVSSIVDGFRDYRQAAREGIEAGGGRPLLVNEDLPSLATSPRNACLDAIDSSDYVVSIAAGRGGWTAPSGFLVVEEEFEHARRRNLRVLGFVQEAPKDADAERFARRISDFVSGGFRTTFSTPAELRGQVERAVREIVSNLPEERPMDADLSKYFSALGKYSGHAAMLRFVLVPEREHELVDPVTLNSSRFKTKLYEIGLQSDVGLLDHESAKSSELRDDTRIVEQSPGGRHGEGEYVHLEVSEPGHVVIDMNVTGRVRRSSPGDGDVHGIAGRREDRTPDVLPLRASPLWRPRPLFPSRAFSLQCRVVRPRIPNAGAQSEAAVITHNEHARPAGNNGL
jgi:hypothetical protein